MNNGSLPLAGVIVLAWGAVYLVTQRITDPPLGTGTTLLIGTGLTVALIFGYPSALRGPRSGRPQNPVRDGQHPGRPGTTIAAVGRSMPLRSGLTSESARRTAQLLEPLLGGDSVAITDRERILAFAGPGADHHMAGDHPVAPAGRALNSGKTVMLRRRSELGCTTDDCPLRTAVIAPLRDGKSVVGTLQVYRLDGTLSPKGVVEGLAGILSLHLELAELNRQQRLAVNAKLDALRAQINPHFLFNTLNTIASKAHTDTEETRRLLVRLSDFFRYAVRQEGHFAEFGQEYFFVRTYVSLEQARYGDRVQVRYDIDPQVLTAQVPVLIIQPLVENAVKHGLADKVDGGTVTLKARVDPLTRTTSIRVSDNGVGVPADLLRRISKGEHRDGEGMGLRNIAGRLASLYGERYRLDIQSTENRGTVVDLRIPLG
ncbi:two-component system LytT family sensor kinase [Lipingzhangella halophila]|uniref:histidine kinase n=1 Tax=Lipingzhangella halophila TaxID=1783352 RepID=A0A7W7W268_9ACTN|nr:histidine kinase [Lipingzhangella halophila]MBB4931441.1 two-component system LytT family sensor kinase [Lipingzhangella halophila]